VDINQVLCVRRSTGLLRYDFKLLAFHLKSSGKKGQKMGMPEVFKRIRKHPLLYIRRREFYDVVAFVNGFDSAIAGGLMIGLHEWLITKLGEGENLAWDELVLRLTFPNVETPSQHLLLGNNQAIAFESLFALLEEFFNDRDAYNGLRRIYLQYECWLKRQSWYGPGVPNWLDQSQGGK
jgi:hypothetical protein